MPLTPLLGQLITFAGNFAPRGYAMCNGQLLPISQNTALFSLLGTNYGGNGTTNFALPDLRGRAPIGTNQGPGLTNRNVGEVGGEESVALTADMLPQHAHSLNADAVTSTAASPQGALPAEPGAAARGGARVAVNLYAPPPATTALAAQQMAAAGGGQAHENRQPVLVLNWCIALQGIFPARN